MDAGMTCSHGLVLYFSSSASFKHCFIEVCIARIAASSLGATASFTELAALNAEIEADDAAAIAAALFGDEGVILHHQFPPPFARGLESEQ